METSCFKITMILPYVYSVRSIQSIQSKLFLFYNIIHKWNANLFYQDDLVGNKKRIEQHISNHRIFMDTLAKKLNINDRHEWYKVTWESINQHGGGSLFSHYNGSLALLLRNVYPEYPLFQRKNHEKICFQQCWKQMFSWFFR